MTDLAFSLGKPEVLGQKLRDTLKGFGFLADIIPRPKFWRDKPLQWEPFRQQAEGLMAAYADFNLSHVTVDYEKWDRMPDDAGQREGLMLQARGHFGQQGLDVGMYRVPMEAWPQTDLWQVDIGLNPYYLWQDKQEEIDMGAWNRSGITRGLKLHEYMYVDVVKYMWGGVAPTLGDLNDLQTHLEPALDQLMPERLILWLGTLITPEALEPAVDPEFLQDYYCQVVQLMASLV